MKPWEKYSQSTAADAGVEDSTPSESAVPWERYAKAAPVDDPSLWDQVKQQAVNLGAGAVRGAASIGATIVAPGDMISDAMNGKGLSLESNRQRRKDVDAALEQLVGADSNSLAYKGGKLAGEVAGTAGVGGVLANGARAVGMSAPIVDGLASSGLSVAGKTGITGAATRALTGAATGAASAGLVNPEDATTGAAIGAVVPTAAKVTGITGKAIAKVLRGPMQSPEVAAAVDAARNAGYVIPPTQAKASFGNRVLEGIAGKNSTAQNASARNRGVTQALAAKSLGLPTDAPLNPDVLSAIRNTAGSAYDAVSSAGLVTPGQAYKSALDKIAEQATVAAEGFPSASPSPVLKLVESLRSDAFDASSAVAMIKQLRSSADDAFRTGNTDVGRAAKAGAKALEDALETHLKNSGQAELLTNFREARTLIAKTYSVQKAMNPATGTIDARKLAAELKKGKLLSGELKQVAEFASSFPKAAQPVEQMGSLPQISPLDFWASIGAAATTQNPLPLLGMLARPGARATALSPVVQNSLHQRPNLISQIPFDAVEQFGARSAPVIGSSSVR